MARKVAVMAFSGGMDSTALLIRLLMQGYEVNAISYDYGQKHKIELQRAEENLGYLSRNGYHVEHQVVDLTSVMSSFHSGLTDASVEVPEGHYSEPQMKQTVVPNRNAIFASILYGHALSMSLRDDCDVIVALGVHSGDHAIYPDCRPEFYEALGNAFAIGNWRSDRVSFDLPYLQGDKRTILLDALDSCAGLELDFDVVFGNTSTSYEPDDRGRASGRTGSDVERILAFHAIGRTDPIEYIDDWSDVLNHALTTERRYREATE